MAGSGFKRFTTLEKLTSADVNNYLMDQSVMVFDDSSDRSTTIGTAVAEGMVSYLKDTNQVEVYDSSSWVAISGDITGVTAGTGLSGGGTAGDVTLSADYAAIGSALALTTGTEGYTALSNGTAGISYQPVSHNYIINGAFDVWQRGTSFTDSGYTSDRWKFDRVFNTSSVSRVNFTAGELDAAGFGETSSYLRINTTNFSDFFVQLSQPVEDVRTLAGQTVTVSFYAKASTAAEGLFYLRQTFGAGGSSDVFYTETINFTTSWQRFTVTKTLDDMTGKTINANSALDLTIRAPGQNITLDIWGVQLEAGSIATPFKRNAPSLQGELAACQRYYWRGTNNGAYTFYGFGGATSTTSADSIISLPTTLRVAPTAVEFSNMAWQPIGGGAITAITSMALATSNSNNLTVSAGVASGLTAGTTYRMLTNNSTSGFMAVSAEL